ncbi:hypothetical protein BD779DRAFT_1438836, partial [Infundibulicybe gibba]
VRNVYLRCGHAETLVSTPEQIMCESRTCKFSVHHPPTCVPPRCTETCWQYRQYPEQYSPNLDRLCPSCCQRRK